MFRKENSPSPVSVSHFGSGSMFEAGSHHRYLVIGFGEYVRVFNMTTCELMPRLLKVADVNYLTESEARDVVDMSELDYTFSDFELLPRGIKNI